MVCGKDGVRRRVLAFLVALPSGKMIMGERSRTGLTFTMKFYAGDCLIARGVACATLSGGGLARFAVPG